jgi:putative membrane protein
MTLGLALVSPLDQLGTALFSAHMAQHALLMLLAAPLLSCSRPLVALLWGLPRAWRRQLSRWWGQRTGGLAIWRGLTEPAVAWTLQTVALWTWHLPALYQATLVSNTVHALQHASFLGSALLFWWALLHGKHGRAGYGMAVLAIFTTAIHSSILGAILTLAPVPLYPAYTATTTAWGLLPIQDQQLAGLIMWVPAGVLYTLAGLAFLAAWLREAERRTLRREAHRWLDEQ